MPANALFHFALPQREYAAVLAAVQYFARKLQTPGERLVAESALTWLQNISGMTLPSEQGSASEEPASVPVTSEPLKGFGNIKGVEK